MRVRRKSIDVGVQIFWMQRHFPGFHYRGGKWIGSLQPSPLSALYRVRIQYRGPRTPIILVDDPVIDADAPHRYPDGSVCLFYPGDSGDAIWKHNSIIALTIVPWTAEWLYFYECWLDTGTWFGDEAPHTGQKKLV